METIEVDKKVHKLVLKIWGKTNKGYNWIAAKLGTYNWLPLEKKVEVQSCLQSKREKAVCPIHERIHDGK